MWFFLRLIALLLALTAGGVFQTLAFASDEHGECEDEAAGDCTDCSANCALCMCCPLRAAPASLRVEAFESALVLLPVLSGVDEPLLSGVGTDIFQPPRA